MNQWHQDSPIIQSMILRRAGHVSKSSMANSLFIHGAVFAVGALVGGGIAATVARKNETTSSQGIARPQQPVAPILQVGTTGNAVIANNVGVVSPPLKYGNPGMQFQPLCNPIFYHLCNQGRLPTNSFAKRMWLVMIAG